MDGKYILGAICAVCLTTIACFAIHNEVNGTLYLTVVGVVGGIFAAAVGRPVYNILVKKIAEK